MRSDIIGVNRYLLNPFTLFNILHGCSVVKEHCRARAQHELILSFVVEPKILESSSLVSAMMKDSKGQCSKFLSFDQYAPHEHAPFLLANQDKSRANGRRKKIVPEN